MMNFGRDLRGGCSALCGVAWLLGGALAADAEHEVAGFAAVLPHIGLSALLAEVFIEIPADFSWVFVGTFAWTCGAVVLGWVLCPLDSKYSHVMRW